MNSCALALLTKGLSCRAEKGSWLQFNPTCHAA
jgi:hypothetical protein